ncbi:MAG: hypothetical protein OXT67_06265 [Zetaproteobacteria bacterium]|nr:hypothetical protein [Zetaproteobacteria bacterium]
MSDDDLQAQEDVQQDMAEGESSAASSPEPSEESTPNASENQEEPKQLPPGKPWVDYVPSLNIPMPTTVVGHLELFMETNNEILSEYEQLRMCFVEHVAHPSYNTLWVQHSAKLMRALVRHKDRLSKIKKKA